MIGYFPGTVLEKLLRNGPVPLHIWTPAQKAFNRYLDEMMSIINGPFPDPDAKYDPDHLFVERVEEGIIEKGGNVDDFRRMMAAFVASVSMRGGNVFWDSNPTMKMAILSYLLEHEPNSLIPPKPQYKYRTTEDPWEPAW